MLVALLLFVQQTKSVTFTHPCAHSPVVLEALGKEMGVKMAPGGSVLQDYFAFKFTDRPVEDVKRLIAETLNAEWVQRGEYLVLDRGPALLQLEQKEDDEWLRSGIEKFKSENPVRQFSIETVKERLFALSTADVASQKYLDLLKQFRGVNPRDLLPAELVRAFPVEPLIALSNGASMRYYYNLDGGSNLPTAGRIAVRRYIERLAESLAEAQKLGADGYYGADGGPLLIGKCDYSLVISKSDGHLEFTLQQTPRRDLQVREPVGTVSFSVFKEYGVRGGKKPELPTFTKAFSLSSTQASLIAVVSTSSMRPDLQSMATADDRKVALKIAMDLVTNEPLSVFGCAPLFAVAEQAGRDFVALVPDGTAIDGTWMSYVGTKDLNVVWNWWLQRMTLREDEETRIMRIQPRYPRFERANRYDRAAISRYINAYLEKGHHDLESVADLAAASDDDQLLARQSDIASRFLDTIMGAHFGRWLAFRAYGELSPAQRRQARAEGLVVYWGSLSPVVRNAAEKLLLASGTYFGQVVPPPTQGLVSGGFGYDVDQVRGAMSGLSSVPADTRVEFRVGVSELLRPESGRLDFWSFGPNLFDADSFAAARKSGSSFEFFNFERAAVATIERLHVAFWVRDVGAHLQVAQIDSGSKNTKYMPLNQLPEPWKTQLADAIKKGGGGIP